MSTAISQPARLEQYRFNLWPYSHVQIQDDTFLCNSYCSVQYVDHVRYDFGDGESPHTSLPTTYCICFSDYIHKMRNKTTAYGTADSLERAIWGSSIIHVFHSPSLIEALAKPYHHCFYLNSITCWPEEMEMS